MVFRRGEDKTTPPGWGSTPEWFEGFTRVKGGAEGICEGARTFLIMWAAACQPRVPMCLLKEMLRCVADS